MSNRFTSQVKRLDRKKYLRLLGLRITHKTLEEWLGNNDKTVHLKLTCQHCRHCRFWLWDARRHSGRTGIKEGGGVSGDDCPIKLSERRPGPNTGLGRASTRRYSPSQPQAVHRMQIRSFQRARRRGHFPFRAFLAYSFLKAPPQLLTGILRAAIFRLFTTDH